MIKYVEIICLSYFCINIFQSYIVSSNFFWAKEPAGILVKLSSFSASYWVFLIKTNLKSTMGQDCLSHLAILCIERTYVNRLDIEKVSDEFSPKKGRSKFFFWPIFRPKNIGNLNIFKKDNEYIPLLSKGILALTINKVSLNLHIFCAHNKPLSQFPPDDF